LVIIIINCLAQRYVQLVRAFCIRYPRAVRVTHPIHRNHTERRILMSESSALASLSASSNNISISMMRSRATPRNSNNVANEWRRSWYRTVIGRAAFFSNGW
jgi:hypothetical protein